MLKGGSKGLGSTMNKLKIQSILSWKPSNFEANNNNNKCLTNYGGPGPLLMTQYCTMPSRKLKKKVNITPPLSRKLKKREPSFSSGSESVYVYLARGQTKKINLLLCRRINPYGGDTPFVPTSDREEGGLPFVPSDPYLSLSSLATENSGPHIDWLRRERFPRSCDSHRRLWSGVCFWGACLHGHM